MAKTMKAAVVHQFGKPLSIDEVPVPEVGQGQILVKIEASGVCHTDLHAADGDWPLKPSPPFIPGHEGAGIVAALGPGVSHVKEGDRSDSHGCTARSGIVTSVCPAGKRSAWNKRTQTIR